MTRSSSRGGGAGPSAQAAPRPVAAASAAPRTAIPSPAAPAALGIPHLAAAAAAALARDVGRADEDADLRVDPAALELSRREGKQAEQQCEKFGFYDCSEVSAIICMFKNCFIPESYWILFAGEYLCSPIYFCNKWNLCHVQNFGKVHQPVSCSCQKGYRSFCNGRVQCSPPR